MPSSPPPPLLAALPAVPQTRSASLRTTGTSRYDAPYSAVPVQRAGQTSPVKMETHKANHLARFIRPIVKKVLGLVFIAAIEDAMAKVAFMPVVTVTGLFGPLHQ